MYHAYAGQVRNGQPVILESVTLPEKARLIITVLGIEEAAETKTKSQRQGEALNELLKSLDEIDDEPLDDEFFKIVNSGVSIRGLDL